MEKNRSSPRRDQKLDDDEVIAARRYRITGTSPPEFVTIRIGLPKPRASDGRYECGAEIREGGRVWVRLLNGIDAFEALQLALMLIGTDLNHINQQLNGLLSWRDGKTSSLAFPTPPEFSLQSVIDSEEAALAIGKRKRARRARSRS
jgi:hypothetical protein